ncbi:hypothetical protein B9Z55_028353 [Caenorhabditis nigoni]|uniref:Uncharacterized protein n=1 Tax=Caenorhabditis nigoni TaxID=1611254 RepID=A0A2G5SCE5_9PELO|nr:hypothetical protein B9Z55_028353 [Caenorhabditis nigoni]
MTNSSNSWTLVRIREVMWSDRVPDYSIKMLKNCDTAKKHSLIWLQKMSGKSLEKEGYQNVECHLPLELEDLVVTSMNISFLLNGPLSPIYYPVITLNESKGKIAKLVAKDVGENLWKKKDTKMSSVIFHWS